LRLLHTADWHLGQSFHGLGRGYEHGRFLAWLLERIEDRAVDALIIAGDVFDVLNPPVAAQAAFFRFLADARRRRPHLSTVVIAGNHDSGARLEAPAPLLAALGVTVVGTWPRLADGRPDPDRLLVPLHTADGAVGAWCAALPFARASDLAPAASAAMAPAVGSANGEAGTDADTGSGTGASTGTDTGTDTSADASTEEEDKPAGEDAGTVTLLAALRTAWDSVFAAGLARQAVGQALVAAGHCHLSGGVVSELSERRVLIGTLEALPADLFPPTLTYVALGHLHRAQTIGGQERLRYSGSPIPLALDEHRYFHQVLLVDLVDGQLDAVTPLPVPRAVEILRVPEHAGAGRDGGKRDGAGGDGAGGSEADALPAVLAALEMLPEVDDTPRDSWPWLEVTVRIDGPSATLRAQVEAALQGRRVRLVKLCARHADAVDGHAQPEGGGLETIDPEDMFCRYHRQACGAEPAPALSAAFRTLLATVQAEEG